MKSTIIILGFVLLFSGCKKGPIVYQAEVTLNRMEIVRSDEKKNPLLIDVELLYSTCPGTQIEILRSGRQLAECLLSKRKKGDKVQAEIIWKWNSLGYYNWEVVKIDDCERMIDPNDEATYNMIEECEDMVIYGAVVGFKCDRIPNDKLIDKCPWFKRE
ncbi:MAG: hypothetical protein H7A24_14360 [Leptospiraceae bacterium]|nr:hypothetical protein [Leptospiraceae bacterium]MCP5513065.1 hypothetical protein [Leptospiraceae bacterium]